MHRRRRVLRRATSRRKNVSQAKNGDTVKIHYSGTLNDGTQFDSSQGREPLEFGLGAGQVIPGFEKAVEGMSVGESKSFTIPPEEAYGAHRAELVQDVPKTALPEDLTPAVGMQLQGTGGNGQTMNLVVTEVKDEAITVDGNHPLAGQDLNFEIELVEIA
jgi:peptidylprolyl isomerase